MGSINAHIENVLVVRKFDVEKVTTDDGREFEMYNVGISTPDFFGTVKCTKKLYETLTQGKVYNFVVDLPTERTSYSCKLLDIYTPKGE